VLYSLSYIWKLSGFLNIGLTSNAVVLSVTRIDVDGLGRMGSLLF
jgi:hypothetical protein